MSPLNVGDDIAVIAPSGFVDPTRLESGLTKLSSWDLNISEGKYLRSKHNYFSGTDSQRLSDLQWALDAPNIKAVFCARGGYGLSRIIDKIDFSGFVKSPKPIIGFSDITLLHIAIQALGFTSIHACMVAQFGNEEYLTSVKKLEDLLFKKETQYVIKYNSEFPSSGQIVGGNLRMIVDSLATSYEINTNGKVLLIEEIGEGYYKIDRMLQHLRRAGKFDSVQGILLGHFTELSDSTPSFGMSVLEIVEEATKDLNIPIISNYSAGHAPPNYPVVLGGSFKIIIEPPEQCKIVFDLS